MTLAIETEALCKRYGDVQAVEGLSLQVAPGEIYAFVGLNGAGKTTTIRMLLGMVRPDSGVARVLQVPVRLGRREPWASVGYLVEIPHAYPELTVRDNLEVARRLHPGATHRDIDQTIERLRLTEYADRPAGTLSQGNAQRLGLAKALLHHPHLLVLDEPANGLDPAGIVEIRHLLLDLTRQEGVTVFMASHILAEVARLAQRIGIIHQGRLVQELDLPALERNRRRRLVLRTRDLQAARRSLEAAGHPAAVLDDGALEVRSQAVIERPEEVSRILVQAGAPATHLVVEEEDLEQYFLRLIGVSGGAA
jgi:ABC-2 type transport system ATP-binding protein